MVVGGGGFVGCFLVFVCVFGVLLVCLGAFLGRFWAVLEASTIEIADMPKTCKNPTKIDEFCLPGARLGRPVGRLGGRPGLLGALLGCLEAILGRLEALLVRLGALWGRLEASWCNLEPSGSCLGPSGSRLDAAKDARTKKNQEADFRRARAPRWVGRP